MPPLDDLLIEHFQLTTGGRGLLLGHGQAQAARALAGAYPAAHLDVIEVDFPTRQRMASSDTRGALPNLTVIACETPFPDSPPDGVYDAVALIMPKGRLLAQRWLALAAGALTPGGRLALAGAKDLGVQSVAHDAEALFGTKGVTLGYKKGQRVIGFVRPAALPTPPAWAERAGVKPGTWAVIRVETPLGRLTLKTLPGVFAFEGLDEGTRLLLENLDLLPGEEALDLGCGVGVIGIYAAQCGARRVELVDSNLLAVAAARRNLADLELAQAQAYPSDALREVHNRNFSLIASNPPFHAGKAVDYQAAQAFLREGRRALAANGRMVIVANRFIRYERILAELFSSVETLAATSRFHVLCARV